MAGNEFTSSGNLDLTNALLDDDQEHVTLAFHAPAVPAAVSSDLLYVASTSASAAPGAPINGGHTASNNALSGTNYIDMLLSTTRWSDTGTGPTVITYSFSGTNPQFQSPPTFKKDATAPFYQAFTGAQKLRVEAALATWEAVANVDFQEIPDTGSSVGDIRFTYAAVDGAFAQYPGIAGGGDSFYDKDSSSLTGASNLAAGNYGFYTFVHEIGHAMGLKHPHEAAGNGNLGGAGAASLDALVFTLMSYRDYVGDAVAAPSTGPGTGEGIRSIDLPQTPMLYDVAAIQYLYGANNSHNDGPTVYDYASRSNINETLWDAGGIDEISWLNRPEAASISLVEGTGSTLGPGYTTEDGRMEARRLWIAFGTDIENATGGSGADVLTGNSLNNVLRGGAGADTLNGGGGIDTADYRGSSGGITVNLTTMTVSGGDAQGDVLISIERVRGGDGNDTFIGSSGNDVIEGGQGADSLVGGAGDDTLHGANPDLIRNGSFENAIGRTILANGWTNIFPDNVDGWVNLASPHGREFFTATIGVTPTDGTFGADLELDQNNTNVALSQQMNGEALQGLAEDGVAYRIAFDFTKLNAAANAQFEIWWGGTSRGTITPTTAWQTWTLDVTGGEGKFSDDTENRLSFHEIGGGDTHGTLLDNVRMYRLQDEDPYLDGGDTLLPGTGNDVVFGHGGNDTATFNDIGPGSDHYDGGTGTDLLILDWSGATLNQGIRRFLPGEAGGLNSAEIGMAVHYRAGVTGNQSLYYKDVERFDITGGSGFDQLWGGDLDDTLRGGAGEDTLFGGKGNDTYVVDNLNDQIVELADGGTNDTVEITVNYTLQDSAHVENLTLTGAAREGTGNMHANTLTGSTGNDMLRGMGGNDTLRGNGGNDTLDGGAGNDVLEGGAGNDVYVIGDANDTVNEAPGGGTADEVRSSIDYTLPANVERLLLTAGRAGTGNTLANAITGSSGSDTLTGGGGNDTLEGKGGNDTYILTATDQNDVVIEDPSSGIDTVRAAFDYVLGNNVENLVLIGNAHTGTGNGLANTLTGGTGNDTLRGLAGNDTIDGGGGADEYDGGAGTDFAVLNLAGTSGNNTIVLNSAEWKAPGGQTLANGTRMISIEHLSLVGGEGDTYFDVSGTVATIAGRQSTNFDGRGGNDTLKVDLFNSNDAIYLGGNGNDTLEMDWSAATAPISFHDVGGGTFEYRTDIPGVDPILDRFVVRYTSVERFVLTDGAGNDDLRGGALNDRIKVTRGHDVTALGDGTDTLVVDYSATTGNDISSEHGGSPWQFGGSLAEGYRGSFAFAANTEDGSVPRVIYTGVEHFDVTTGAGNDTLRTGDGNDRIVSGAGNDHLISAKGLDTIDGGAGSGDRWTADKSAATANMTVNLTLTGVQSTYALPGITGTATVRGIEVLTLQTGSGNDVITTLAVHTDSDNFDDDTITTNGGNDRVKVAAGWDTVHMGDGTDTLVVDYSATTGNDISSEHGGSPWQFGGSLAEEGYRGSFAFAANTEDGRVPRVIYTGVEHFDVTTGDGNDTLRTGDGNDRIVSGAGNDHLISAKGLDTIDGGAGSGDRWTADKSDATANMTVNLTLTGVQSTYALPGITGTATVRGIEVLTLQTGSGNDVITTLAVHTNSDNFDDDTITTNGGDDRVKVAAGWDTVHMGDGTDTLVVDYSAVTQNISSEHGGSPWQFGGSLAEGYRGSFAFAANTEDGSVPRVIYTGVEHFDVTTGAGNDTLRTGDGNDRIVSGAGNDHLISAKGLDTIDGGAGSGDRWTADKSAATANMTVNLTLTGVQSTYALPGITGTATVRGIEALTLQTGSGNDVITTLAVHTNSDNFDDDTITTNGGDDRVTVAGGWDTVDMGDGTDTLVVDYSATTGNDISSEHGGSPWQFGGSLAEGYRGSFAFAANTEDGSVPRVIYTGVEHFDVTTGAGNDTLRTGDGNDRIVSGAGNDHLISAKGLDTIDGGAGSGDRWTADKSAATANMTVNLTLTGVQSTYALPGITGTATVRGIEVLTLQTGSGNDVITTLAVHTDSDNFDDDTITTNGGNDRVKVAAGWDTVHMGDGTDTLVVDYSATTGNDISSEHGGSPWQFGGSLAEEGYRGSFAFAANTEDGRVPRVIYTGVEHFDVTTGDGNDTLRTGDGNDRIVSGAGNDHLISAKGLDTIDGGAGSGDRWTADKSDATANMTVNLTLTGVQSTYALPGITGTATVRGIEVLTLQTGSGNDVITTLAVHTNSDNFDDDTITTNGGDDRVKVAAGWDTVHMGDGTDTLVVDYSAVTQNISSEHGGSPWQFGGSLAEGYRGSFAFAANTEDGSVPRVIYTGVEHFDVTTGAGNDFLRTGDGNDILNGGAGLDTLVGGGGDDLYILTDAGDVVIESADAGTDTVRSAFTYTLGAHVENLVLTGNATKGTGNALANELTGNTRANTLSGAAGNDSLNGGAGNDTLDGGAGNDTLMGGIGDDLYILTNADDVVIESANAGTDTVQSSVTHTLAANVENLVLTGNATKGTGNALANELTGNARANTLSGAAGNDMLNGGAGNDTLDGGAGNDTLMGGIGDDLYILTNAGDVVSENADAGTDTVQSSVTHTLAANVENLVLTGNATRGTGNALANEITGNTRANTLSGEAGNDSLGGGAGNDTLNGGSGNDTLNGGLGTDRLVGDVGDDLYILTDADDVVIESANAGTDTVQSSVTHTLGAHVENLVLTGNATRGTGNALANVLTGNTRANTLSGEAGNDSLGGGAGNDTLNGGSGNDTLNGGLGTDRLVGDVGDDLYILTDADDVVIESANAGTDTVQSSVTHTLADNVENLVLTGNATRGTGNALANVLTGNTRANTLSGEAGNDSLGGGAGNDTLNGGSGNDTLNGGLGTDRLVGDVGDDLYILTDADDVIIESANAGTDTVQSSVTHTLADNVENLVLTGNATRGTGNALANVLTGNTRANTLSGEAGNDSLGGGAGNDTLNGGSGNDTLNGGLGTDRLVGDVGDDLYILTDADDVVIESANAGTDTVQSSVTHTLAANVENLVLTGNATRGTGNALANVLTGNTRANTLSGEAGNDSLGGGSGNDTLNGGSGNDTLNGGLGTDRLVGDVGDDLYILTDAGDVIIESANAGTDTVQSSVTHTLADNVENLVLTGNATRGTGNTLANELTGNTRANTLSGEAGNDSLDGGAGNDTLNGGSGNDTLNGGLGTDRLVGDVGDDLYILTDAGDVIIESANAGTDTVQSSVTHTLADNVENLVLTGNATRGTGNTLANEITGNTRANTLSGDAGNDSLDGGAGNDTLNGGTGNDTLNGGDGTDRFLFDTALNGTTNVDVIVDFNPSGETLLLDDVVFTGLAMGTLAGSAFRNGTQAQDASDRIIYNSTTGAVLFDVDGLGGASAVQFATLSAGLAMSANDFVVV